VSTYPNTTYDLEEVLTSLGIGEAIVTVMSDKGAPTPVAWTRLRAPQGSMDPTPSDQIQAAVAASPLLATYGTAVNPQSASEILGAKAAASAGGDVAATADETSKEWERKEAERLQKEADRLARQKAPSRPRSRRMSPVDRAVGEASRTLARELIKNLFRKRR
jgi:hypothetical protein